MRNKEQYVQLQFFMCVWYIYQATGWHFACVKCSSLINTQFQASLRIQWICIAINLRQMITLFQYFIWTKRCVLSVNRTIQWMNCRLSATRVRAYHRTPNFYMNFNRRKEKKQKMRAIVCVCVCMFVYCFRNAYECVYFDLAYAESFSSLLIVINGLLYQSIGIPPEFTFQMI